MTGAARLLVVALAAAMALLAGPRFNAPDVSAVPPASPVTPHPLNLNPEWKGRTYGMAVDPTNKNVVFASTQSGGLYKTTNGGGSWSHVDSLPSNVHDTNDVAIFPDASNIIIVSADADSSTTNGGGIWRSVDGGATWQKPATSDDPNVACTARRSSFGIGATTLGRVVVGTACGVARSSDFGATWTHQDPTPGGSRQVNDVVAQSNGKFDICAQDGHHRSTNSGGSWSTPSAGIGGCGTIDVSPLDPDVLYATANDLYEGDPDGGGNIVWTNLNASAAGNIGPAVQTHRATDGDAAHYDVFYSDGTFTYRQHCTGAGPGVRCPVVSETGAQCANAVDDDGDQIVNEGCPVAGASGETTGLKGSDPQCNDATNDDGGDDALVNDGCPNMMPYATEHHDWFDHRVIAFDPSSPTGCPMLIGGDGGIGKTSDCGVSWTSDADGLEANQLYEVTGVVHPGHTDLYFGTQDDLIWASPNNGATWPNPVYYEGFFLEMPHSLAGDNYEVTGVVCGPCNNFRHEEHFSNSLGWPDPPFGGGNPFLVENGLPGRYVQVSNNTLWLTEPETGADCDAANTVDDDADNAVNDGCPADGAAETGVQCHNNADDDGDGKANDGCSHLNSKESGAECANSTDDDGDGANAINDGCPKVGTFSEQNCTDAVDDADEDPNTAGAQDDDAVVNDGCPEVGVWASTLTGMPGVTGGRLTIVGPPASPTIYFASGGGLRKINAIGNGSAVLTNISAGITALGQSCRIFVCLQAFGVDPNDAQHLIAADVGAGQMKVSRDAGLTWTPDLELTALATDNGRLQFQFGGSSQVKTIEFSPTNGNEILVGTEDAGIIATFNDGVDWFAVEGSTRINTITSFFFDEFNGLTWVSSFGRGLWKLDFPATDLSITKSDHPDPVKAGEELFYDITVENNGPNPATVEVLDNLPPQVTYLGTDLIPPLGCIEFAPSQLRCDLGVLQSGDVVTFTIRVRVASNAVSATPASTIYNTAIVLSTDTVDPNLSNNSDTEATFVTEEADLRVTKLCKPDGPLPAGQIGTCTIYVDNLGPSDARNVVMDDAIVSDGAFNIGTVTPSQGTCDPPTPDNVVHCDLGDLVAYSTVATGRATITIDVSANEGVDINDVATAVSDTPDPNTANNIATESINVSAVSDLALTKADAPDPVVAGTTLTYTLEVSNAGPSTAVNVVIEDVLPTGVTVNSVSAPGGSCNAGTPGDPFNPTTCTFDSMASGGPAKTMTIVVTVGAGVLGLIQNDARVSSDVFDPDNTNDLATATTTVNGQADLVIEKEDSPDPVVAGRTITYTLTVHNDGPSRAYGVVVEDALPDEVSYLGATIANGDGSCVLIEVPPAPPTTMVTCNLGDMEPNASSPVVIHIDAQVKSETADETIMTNVASVSSTTTDPDGTDNESSVTTFVLNRADLGILKSSDKDTYKPSSTIQYTIAVTNYGESDALSVQVIDVLPAIKGAVYVFDTGGCTKTGGFLFCSLGTIAAGQTKSFNVHVRIKGSKGQITNIANVSSLTFDPNPANDQSTRVVLVKGGI